ncbi:hypothetical protein R1flu_021719 [Riccia fluitans]|uniref:Uncharacterized protein n=1 Tax=Riccia fluitans TaxID=41844 RepID=A0ABD1ZRZ7_9MARC
MGTRHEKKLVLCAIDEDTSLAQSLSNMQMDVGSSSLSRESREWLYYMELILLIWFRMRLAGWQQASAVRTESANYVSLWQSIRNYNNPVDFEEHVLIGLENAAKLDWQAMNRILVHISDAPCHGVKFQGADEDHKFYDNYDDYPEGDKYNRDIRTILRTLRVL